jgi:uncharacterized membrane protein
MPTVYNQKIKDNRNRLYTAFLFFLEIRETILGILFYTYIMTKHHFSFQEVFKFGWAKTKQHAWFSALTFIIATIIISAVRMVPLFDAIVSLMVGISITSISLLIARDHSFTFTDLVSPLLSAKKVLNMFVLTAIYGVAVLLGTILLIVPGVYVAVRFKFFPYIVIENENASIKDLIRMTYKLSTGHFWPLFFFLAIAAVLNVLGSLLFVIGLVVTVPVTVFASAYMYSRLKEHTI